MANLYSCNNSIRIPRSRGPIEAGPADTQLDGDFRGPDAIGLQSGFSGSLPPCRRCTAIVAALPLGLGSSLPPPLQRVLPLDLADGADLANMPSLTKLFRVLCLPISDQPVHPAQSKYAGRERKQCNCLTAAKIEDNQLADDCQHRNQDDGADMHDALLPLGYEQQSSTELQCDNYREDHPKQTLERCGVQ
jgi:hypothetical protein